MATSSPALVWRVESPLTAKTPPLTKVTSSVESSKPSSKKKKKEIQNSNPHT